jgi:hypothetical protein
MLRPDAAQAFFPARGFVIAASPTYSVIPRLWPVDQSIGESMRQKRQVGLF